MKRFMLYLVVVIVSLSVGLLTYAFAVNTESSVINILDNTTIYLNPGDEYENPYSIVRQSKKTDINIDISDDSLVEYDPDSNIFTAKANGVGGMAIVTITPTNDKLPKSTFGIWVGNGSAVNPYFIKSAEDLARIGTDDRDENLWTLSKCYRVVKNIDMSTLNKGKEKYLWNPIGSENEKFTGTFDTDQNYTISNVIINPDVEYAGLFGVISDGAVISNLIVSNMSIDDSDASAIGAIAGVSYGTIKKCRVNNFKVNISSSAESSTPVSSQYVGGVTGKLIGEQSWAEIQMCEVVNSKLNSTGALGGISGLCDSGVIFNCKASSSIISNASLVPSCVGGIAGDINQKTYTQNIAGYEQDEYIRQSVIQKCISYNSYNGSISIDSDADYGVVVGKTCAGFDDSDCKNNVFIGDNIPSAWKDDGNLSAKRIRCSTMSINTNDVQKASSYAAVKFDFEKSWSIEEGISDPSIRMDGEGETPDAMLSGFRINESTVSTVVGKLIAGNASKHIFTITENCVLDMAGAEFEFAPIGTFENPYQGYISAEKDEQGNPYTLTIKNIDYSSAENKHIGFFGYVGSKAHIEGIVLENIHFNSTAEGAIVGGVAGYSEGKILNCKVGNSSDFSTNSVTNAIDTISTLRGGLFIDGGDVVGGIVGTNLGEVRGCEIISDIVVFKDANGIDDKKVYSSLNTYGSAEKIVGGFVGNNGGIIENTNGSIAINSESTRAVRVGGMVGYNNGSIISCSRIFQSVSGSGATANVGGVVGFNNGKILNCHTPNGSLSAIVNSNSFLGGIVGYCTAKSAIELSSSQCVLQQGYYVGGIAGYQAGVVSKSYASNTISNAVFASGLSPFITGQFYNCYFIANGTVSLTSVEGVNKPVYAGFGVRIQSTGLVSHCYTACLDGVSAGTGKFEAYTESRDDVRSAIKKRLTGKLEDKVNQTIEKNDNFFGRLLAGVKTIWSTITGDALEGSVGTIEWSVVNTAVNTDENGQATGSTIKNPWDTTVINKVGIETWGKNNAAYRYFTVNINHTGVISPEDRNIFVVETGFDTNIWNFEGNWPVLQSIEQDGYIDSEEVEEPSDIPTEE